MKKKYNFEAVMVKPHTKRRFRLEAVKADKTNDEFLNYLLDLKVKNK